MNVEERERERLAVVARNKADAAPVVGELRAAGFAIEGIADLFNRRLNYQKAIPILLAWLPKVTNPNVKEDIIRALSVKWAKRTVAAALLLVEFERADDASLRWAIGNALEVLATVEIADDLIRLATDRRYGRARQMVVLGLGKLKDARVVGALIDLLADEDVVGHAVIALGKLQARAARSRIESLLDHPKSWIRKEAKKALARIDKAG
jgi:hypothetical protein